MTGVLLHQASKGGERLIEIFRQARDAVQIVVELAYREQRLGYMRVGRVLLDKTLKGPGAILEVMTILLPFLIVFKLSVVGPDFLVEIVGIVDRHAVSRHGYQRRERNNYFNNPETIAALVHHVPFHRCSSVNASKGVRVSRSSCTSSSSIAEREGVWPKSCIWPGSRLASIERARKARGAQFIVLLSLEVGEDLLGALDDFFRQSGELAHLNAVGSAGYPLDQPTQKDNALAAIP